MKCLSVKQPWATLLVRGAKRFETRCWSTEHRGPLAIHACQTFPEAARQLCSEEPFRSLLRAAGIKGWFDLPRGAVLGQVELVDCRPVALVQRNRRELILGDYRPGRWAWEVAEPRELLLPRHQPGRLGLFEIEDLDGLLVKSSPVGSRYAAPEPVSIS